MAIANQIQGERLPESTDWVNQPSDDNLVMVFPDSSGIIGTLKRSYVDELVDINEGGF